MSTTTILFNRFVGYKADGGFQMRKIGVEIKYPDYLDTYVSRSHAVLDYVGQIFAKYGLYTVWANGWYTSFEVATSKDARHGAHLDVAWLNDSQDASMVNLDDFCKEVKDYLG